MTHLGNVPVDARDRSRFDYLGGVVIVDEVLSERPADDRAIFEAAEAREHELGKEVARADPLPGADLIEALGR